MEKSCYVNTQYDPELNTYLVFEPLISLSAYKPQRGRRGLRRTDISVAVLGQLFFNIKI